jgi:hypothetical protein
MPKPRGSRIEEAVEKVLALRERPDATALVKALEHSSARVVLAAAQIIEGLEETGGWPQLERAFARLLDEREPHKSDPMCRAKVALLRAMLRLEAEGERAAYERGRTYVQREPVWGGQIDTAGELRGLCVLGLVRARHPDAALFAAEALVDAERATRVGVLQALAEAPPDSALPLLRYKLATGDKEPEVVGACFSAFLELAPGTALALAPTLLSQSEGPDAEVIALALGESKKREAFPVLRDVAETASADVRGVAFVAMTLLRDEAATAHLLHVVEQGPASHAEQALQALAHFRHDPKLRERALGAVKERGEAKVTALAREVLAKE